MTPADELTAGAGTTRSGSSAPGWQGGEGADSGAIGGDDNPASRDAGTREPGGHYSGVPSPRRACRVSQARVASCRLKSVSGSPSSKPVSSRIPRGPYVTVL